MTTRSVYVKQQRAIQAAVDAAVVDLKAEIELLNRALNEATSKLLDAEKVRDASYDEIADLDQRINEQDREIERLQAENVTLRRKVELGLKWVETT